MKTLVYLKAAINLRIVDQTLPANGRPGLFQVRPHDNVENFGMLFSLGEKPSCILFRSMRIVYRKWANHHEQMVLVVYTLHNLGRCLP